MIRKVIEVAKETQEWYEYGDYVQRVESKSRGEMKRLLE